MVIEVGPKSSTNDIANTAEVAENLFTVMKLFIRYLLPIKVYKLIYLIIEPNSILYVFSVIFYHRSKPVYHKSWISNIESDH